MWVYIYITQLLKIQQYKHKTHGFRTFSCFGPIERDRDRERQRETETQREHKKVQAVLGLETFTANFAHLGAFQGLPGRLH